MSVLSHFYDREGLLRAIIDVIPRCIDRKEAGSCGLHFYRHQVVFALFHKAYESASCIGRYYGMHRDANVYDLNHDRDGAEILVKYGAEIDRYIRICFNFCYFKIAVIIGRFFLLERNESSAYLAKFSDDQYAVGFKERLKKKLRNDFDISGFLRRHTEMGEATIDRYLNRYVHHPELLPL